MSESENALPLDDSFWEHIEHIDFAIAIPVSDTRMLDIISALRDVYETICNNKIEEAKMCVTALAAILVASKYDKAEEVWEEFSVKEAMRNFDTSIKEILDEKS
jgi:CO dehydrogenase/acetyl-CoA synthase delta subunit